MTLCNEALVASIRNRLWSDRRLAGLCIDVCCTDGHVSLLGCVDNPQQKSLALQVVYGVIGVRHVNDELTIRCPRSVSPGAAGTTDAAAL